MADETKLVTSTTKLQWACGHTCGAACVECFREYADDHRRLYEEMDCGHRLTSARGGKDGYSYCMECELRKLGFNN